MHPFSLLSSHVERILAEDISFFEVRAEPVSANTVASSFVNSRIYQNHPLVQERCPLGETILPVSMYWDGLSIGSDPYEDTLYNISFTFLHRSADENAKPLAKHTFTVYRKSQMTDDTLDDIMSILLWELHALVQGRLPKAGEEQKPLSEQEHGDHIFGNWGSFHKLCLMQLRADGAAYSEDLGIRQWNCCMWMCPWCGAHRDGQLSWHNFALDAPWHTF